jgi:hypothetical protein
VEPVVSVLDDCVAVCRVVWVSLGGGVNSCDVVEEIIGNGGVVVARLEVDVAVDFIGGTTRVLEPGGGG